MSNNEAAIPADFNIVHIRVYMPGGPVLTFGSDQLVTWLPSAPGLVTKDAEGRLHQFVGCGFEVVMQPSLIARPT